MKRLRNRLVIIAIFLGLIIITLTKLQNYMIVKVDTSTQIHFLKMQGGIELVLGEGGINKIYGIQSVNFYNNLFYQMLNIEDNGLIAGSDFVGPYILREITTATSESGLFTGGWHGSNGDATGIPTAKCTNVTIKTDDIKTDKMGYYICKKLEIKVKNLITSYNSDGQFVMVENVTYSILPDSSMDIVVESRALENIEIVKYYGMQLIIPSRFNTITYLEAGHMLNSFNYIKGRYNDSPTYTDEIVVEDTIRKHRLSAKINVESGLGSFAYKDNSQPYAFTTDYGKSYFNLINGNSLLLNKGDSVSWAGTYKFK